MDAAVLQSVFNKISGFLPDGWTKVVFYAEYTRGSYSMKFYSANESGRYIDCFSLPEVSRTALIRSFMDIDSILSESRGIGEKTDWTVLTMKVDSTGHVTAYLDYEDHSDDIVSFRKKWEHEYLSY